MQDEEEDSEFEALVRELSSDISVSDYVNFDAEILTTEPFINVDEIDWREKAREECIRAVMNPNESLANGCRRYLKRKCRHRGITR